MACNKPKKAWRLVGGAITFARSPREPVLEALELPCYQCAGCKKRRVSDWSTRILHESRLHEISTFCTFTYDDAHLPADGALQLRDFQLFMKSLRDWIHRHGDRRKIRVFYCGEYGGPPVKAGQLGFRPHYHAVLFGWEPPDKSFWQERAGHRAYKSALLDRLWGRGMTELGSVTPQSCSYVAGYVNKKLNGVDGFERYLRTDPATGRQWLVPREFAHMSTGGGGIGAAFANRWKSDIFPCDYCVIDGRKGPVPKFYSRKLKKSDPDMYDEVVQARKVEAMKHLDDNTPERLAVKEECARLDQERMRRSKL